MNGDNYWMWQNREADGKWSLVTAFIPALQAHGPLIARSEKGAESFRNLAEHHALKTGRPVRCAHFKMQTVKEEVGGHA